MRKRRAVLVEELMQPEMLARIHPACRAFQEAATHVGYDYDPDDHKDRPQLQFHQSEKMNRLILGGNRSGKTFALAHEIRWHFLDEHPWIRLPTRAPKIWVISASYVNIMNGVWRHLKEIVPPWRIVDRGNRIAKTDIPFWITSDTGAQIFFYSDVGGTAARKRIQSDAVDFVAVDEEISDESYGEIDMRRATTGGRMAGAMTALESSDWVLDLEEVADAGSVNVDLFRFNAMRAVDAGHADRDVIMDRMERSTPEQIEIRIHGKTKRRHGQVYPTFSSRHVIAEQEIPGNWKRFRSLDPGVERFAVLWGAQQPNGRVILYRELYLHRPTLAQVADEIRRLEGWAPNRDFNPEALEGPAAIKWVEGERAEKIEVSWIDPKNFGQNVGGAPMVGNLLAWEQPVGYGLPCIPAQNEVEYGIAIVQRWLEDWYDGMPRVLAFNTLTNFLKERTRYRRLPAATYGALRDERNARPVKKDDHLMDAWRYMMVGIECESGSSQNDDYLQAALSAGANPTVEQMEGLIKQAAYIRAVEEIQRRAENNGTEHHSGLGNVY